MNPQGKSLFIFDFDGVIIESTQIKHKGFLAAAQKTSVDLANQLDVALGSILRGAERTRVAEWATAQCQDVNKEAFLMTYANYLDTHLKTAKMVTGLQTFLEKAILRKKLCAIASAAPREDIMMLLSHYHLPITAFCEVKGSEDGKKISAMTALLERYKISSTNAIFFGDTPSDEEAAAATHMDFVRVLSFAGNLCQWAPRSDRVVIEDFTDKRLDVLFETTPSSDR